MPQKTQRKISTDANQNRIIGQMASFYDVNETDIATRCFMAGFPLVQRQYAEDLRLKRLEEKNDAPSLHDRAIAFEAVRSLLDRLAVGEMIGDAELLTLAHDADLNIETLKEIRDCLQRKNHHDSVIT